MSACRLVCSVCDSVDQFNVQRECAIEINELGNLSFKKEWKINSLKQKIIDLAIKFKKQLII